MKNTQLKHQTHIYPLLLNRIEGYKRQFQHIDEKRKGELRQIADFVSKAIATGQPARLIFICTHNSRRSHMAQVWAQTAAAYYGIRNVLSYSGGTEATAFNPRAVKAMQEAGFRIEKITDTGNPLYDVRFADDAEALQVFSKKYDDDSNPKAGFAAVMTCSHADENCPLVAGAAARISTPYNDPKDFDGTPEEESKYLERADQIGRDIMYAFSLVVNPK